MGLLCRLLGDPPPGGNCPTQHHQSHLLLLRLCCELLGSGLCAHSCGCCRMCLRLWHARTRCMHWRNSCNASGTHARTRCMRWLISCNASGPLTVFLKMRCSTAQECCQVCDTYGRWCWSRLLTSCEYRMLLQRFRDRTHGLFRIFLPLMSFYRLCRRLGFLPLLIFLHLASPVTFSGQLLLHLCQFYFHHPRVLFFLRALVFFIRVCAGKRSCPCVVWYRGST